MKILVYGVGAIGSLMVHFLCRAGNDVTVAARSTYKTLKENGLVVVHRIQNKTTVDRPKVVKQADLNEKYDIVFSVMQAEQQKNVLDILSKVNTRLVVLVGNDPEADFCERYIKEHMTKQRYVLFGFQDSAGCRKDGKAMVGRLPVTGITVGGLHEKAAPKAIAAVKHAFRGQAVKITETNDMYGYYLYHIAEIMPYCYISYKYGNDLKKAVKSDMDDIMRATKECFGYLTAQGIKPVPEGEEKYYSGGIKTLAMKTLYRIMSKTALGNIMVAEHCENGIKEMQYLDTWFEKYRAEHSGTPMPTWDRLRKCAVLVWRKNGGETI